MNGLRHKKKHGMSDMRRLRYALQRWSRKGGKRNRRRRARRVCGMLADLGPPRAVSRKALYVWIESAKTGWSRYDRYLTARIFWKIWHGTELPRPRCAPRPHTGAVE